MGNAESLPCSLLSSSSSSSRASPGAGASDMNKATATMDHRSTPVAGTKRGAHTGNDEPTSKRPKLSQNDVSEPSATLSQAKTNLYSTLLSKAGFLLRQASALKNDNHVPLSHDSEQQIKDIFAQHINDDLLRMHRQLDRVEAEHAKVQTMLEQIRRCNADPYPAWDRSQQLEPGVEKIGPLVEMNDEQGGHALPQYDSALQMPHSPYMEHYKRWLIPDPRVAPRVIAEQHEVPINGRNTRKSHVVSTEGQAAAAIDFSPDQPIQTVLDPVILKNSNGDWVRLRCDLGKCGGTSDFKSIQGFINHCRLDHDVRHPTHAAAADACGLPVDLTEEVRQMYEAKFSKGGKAKRSRLVPGDSAVNYDGIMPRRNASKKTEIVNVVKFASNDMKSAYEPAPNKRNGYVPTVHPFNLPHAKLPTVESYELEDKASVKVENNSHNVDPLISEYVPATYVPQPTFTSVVNCTELPYLSKSLQGRTAQNGAIVLDLNKLTKDSYDAKALVQAELDSYDSDDAEQPASNVSKSKAKPKDKTKSQDQKKKRGRPSNASRSKVGGMELPTTSRYPLSSSQAAAFYSPLDTQAPTLHLSPAATQSFGASASADLQSPHLPGLMSDHGSVADEDETHDFKAGSAGSLQVDIEDGEDIHMGDAAVEVRRSANRAASTRKAA